MKKIIEFTNLRVPMLILSLLVIIAGGAYTFFVQDGFYLGIDFAAGMNVQVRVATDDVNADEIRQAVSAVEGADVQTVGDDGKTFNIRVKEDPTVESFASVYRNKLETLLNSSFGAANVEVLSQSFIAGSSAESLTNDTILMVVGTLILILVYITFRFRVQYGFSAIVTLAHDVFVMLAVIGAFQIEFSAATVAAILTVIGYSLNDTIVVFDRIRENEQMVQDRDFKGIINLSIGQSLSRTIITSITTLLAIGAVFFLASGQIKDFALNMMIGIGVGTYSSIFIASPLLLSLSGNKKAHAPAKVEVSTATAEVAAAAGGTTAADLNFKGSKKKKRK